MLNRKDQLLLQSSLFIVFYYQKLIKNEMAQQIPVSVNGIYQ